MNIKKIADSIFQTPSENELIQRWLDTNCTKNSDGTYNILRSVIIGWHLVKNGKFLVKFKKAYSNFFCWALDLTSLDGCPEFVQGSFDCSENKLTSLDECPSFVGKDFDCSLNRRIFSEKEVNDRCKVDGRIILRDHEIRRKFFLF